MSEGTITISLYELVRLALPVGTTYATDEPQRTRTVGWATIVGLPLRGHVMADAGDFVFCTVRSGDPKWAKALADLARARVAGVGTADPVPPEAVEKARRLGLTLVVLPEGSNLREAHRSALTLLINRQSQMTERAAQVHEHLVRLTAEGASLEALARALSEITGNSVLVQDKRLQPIAQVPVALHQRAWETVLNELSKVDSLPDGWSDRQTAANIRAVVHQAVGDGLARLVTPIAVGRLARGYLSVIGGAEELDSFDALAVEQGAAACALEMSKAKAVSEATKQLRGDFVDAVLARAIPPKEIQRWARRIGHDISAPHAVVACAWSESAGLSLRRLETIVNGEIGLGRVSALVRAGDGEVAAFVALDPTDPLKTVRGFAQAVHAQAMREYPKAGLLCGIGRPALNVAEWRTSYKEAGQALAAARRLGERGPLYFGDLSVHRLLLQLEGNPDLDAFVEETLGALIAYDRAHHSNLLHTLSAYFANGGNLSQTAEALFVHRNTLQYRMERINQISALDLNNPETKLAVHLALKAYRLLNPDNEVAL
jgi:purine catabolism regulator